MHTAHGPEKFIHPVCEVCVRLFIHDNTTGRKLRRDTGLGNFAAVLTVLSGADLFQGSQQATDKQWPSREA